MSCLLIRRRNYHPSRPSEFTLWVFDGVHAPLLLEFSVLCFYLVCLRSVLCPKLPMSLDCPYYIAPPVLLNLYVRTYLEECLLVSLDCPYYIATPVFLNLYVRTYLEECWLVSLDCSYLLAPSVFSNVYLRTYLDECTSRINKMAGKHVIVLLCKFNLFLS